MDCRQWIELFGRSADDGPVREALAKAGITKRLRIGRDELSTRKDISGEGTTIVFTDESILKSDTGGVVGRPILSAVMVVLQDPNPDDIYKGPLPYQLRKADSRDQLRARFGNPVESNEDYRTDAWNIDGLTVAASYSKDLQGLTQVSVSLPKSR